MNYAWSNPVTGLREQTLPASSAHPDEQLRQEATSRAWVALQSQEPIGSIFIHQQIPCGSITAKSESHVDLIEIMKAGWNEEDCEFAFCHPTSGHRIITSQWPSELKEIIASDPQGITNEVIIYATRPAFVVRRSDPEPPAPPHPEPTAQEMGLDDLEALHQEVRDFIDLEGGNPAPKATALALIDIARSLRRLLGEFTPPNPLDMFPLPKVIVHPSDGEPVIEYCTCTGDGLTADGAYCVCPAGMARKRAAAVANRAPTQEPALPAQPDKSLLCPHNAARESCPFCNPKIAFYTAPLQKKDSGTVNEVSPDGPKREESGE